MRKKWYGLSLILPILIVLIAYYGLNLYPFSEQLPTSGDFTTQYLPLYYALKNVIYQGDWRALFWSFNKGLGGSMASVYGFNSLSPLTLSLAIVPVSWFPPVLLLVGLLRYGLASLAFFHFLWIRQSLKDKDLNQHWFALAFSLIYGLSGYMVANSFNPNFLDNLIYFPLVMIGVEKILEGKKSRLYPLGLGLMCITQFYTAYMASLGIGIYSIYYLALQDEAVKVKGRRFLTLIGKSLLGVGLAAVWLLPVFFNLLDSKAAADKLFEWRWESLFDGIGLLIKLVPGAISFEEWGDAHAMPQIYLASLGLIGLLHHFLNPTYSRRQKIATFILLTLIFLSVNQYLFDLIWHMGQRPVGFYFRNAWVFVWILLVISYRSLERQPQIKKYHIPFYLLLTISLAWSYWFTRSDLTSWPIIGMTVLIWISLVGVLLSDPLQNGPFLLLALIIFELGWNTSQGLGSTPYFSKIGPVGDLTSLYDLAPIQNLKDDEAFYRSDISANNLNMNLYTSMKPVGHFTSSIDYSLIEVFSKLGLPSSKAMVTYLPHPLTDALFSIKYIVMPNNMKSYEEPIVQGLDKVGQFNQYMSIYRQDTRLGLGFMVTKSFNHDLDLDLDIVENQEKILQDLGQNQHSYYQKHSWNQVEYPETQVENGVLRPQGEGSLIHGIYTLSNVSPDKTYFIKIPHNMTFYLSSATFTVNGERYAMRHRFNHDQLWPVQPDAEGKIVLEIKSTTRDYLDLKGLEVYEFDLPTFQALIAQKTEDNLQVTRASNHLIQGRVRVEDEVTSSLFLSIPYNRGWEAYLNGQAVDTYPVWDAFTGLDLPGQGDYDVELKYVAPGFKLGLLMSLVSFLVWGISLLPKRVKKPKEDEKNGRT